MRWIIDGLAISVRKLNGKPVPNWNPSHFIFLLFQIYGLHFGIFRRTCFDVFQLVSDTYINGQTTGTNDERWVAWKPGTPIPVRRGDVIGVFYDNLHTPHETISLRSVTLPDDYQYAPKQFAKSDSLVFLQDARDLGKSNGCVRLGDGRASRRIPALFILMDPIVEKGRHHGNRTAAFKSGANEVGESNEIKIGTHSRQRQLPDVCERLPKFEYSCDSSLGVRYYFDKIANLCRQFLYCPTNAEAAEFGFKNRAECNDICKPSQTRKSKSRIRPRPRDSNRGATKEPELENTDPLVADDWSHLVASQEVSVEEQQHQGTHPPAVLDTPRKVASEQEARRRRYYRRNGQRRNRALSKKLRNRRRH